LIEASEELKLIPIDQPDQVAGLEHARPRHSSTRVGQITLHRQLGPLDISGAHT